MDTQQAAVPDETPTSMVGTPANLEAQPGTTDIRNAVTSIVGASVAALLPQINDQMKWTLCRKTGLNNAHHIQGYSQCLSCTRNFIRNAHISVKQWSYQSAQRTSLRICDSCRTDPFPASQHLLILFVADQSQRVCYTTIRVYLTAVGHLQMGLGDPLKGMQKLDLILKGAKRTCIKPNLSLSRSRVGHSISMIEAPAQRTILTTFYQDAWLPKE
jgi:hypothetical protein